MIPLARIAPAIVACLLLAAPAPAAEQRDLFGWVEWATLEEAGFELKAKLDTGAETSSLDAIHIRRFRRGGVSRVRFTIEDPASGDEVTLDLPLERRVRIKRHEGESQRRPVVALTICLGDHRREVEFSLIDRSEFLYPVLLGRSALAGIAVVDPDLTFTTEPSCEAGDGDGDSDGDSDSDEER